METQNSVDNCNFQIGQCRITVDLKRTKEFYDSLPKISDNCPCEYCRYFQESVIKRPLRLFEILTEMQVDLNRQPNINPDGVSCVGEIGNDHLGYMGYYFVYGKFGKTTKKSASFDAMGNIDKVEFNSNEFGKGTNVTFKKADDEKIMVEFYIEVEIE